MQRATLGKCDSKEPWWDSENIFQQQLGENHGDDSFYSIYFDSDILWLLGLLLKSLE